MNAQTISVRFKLILLNTLLNYNPEHQKTITIFNHVH